MTKAAAGDDLGEQLAVLANLDLYALRDLWRTRFGDAPPSSQSASFLRQEFAWRLQARVYGDLDPGTRRRLATLARWRESDRAASASAPRVGATIVKEWNGAVYTVLVAESGYELDGAAYASLSAVARKITGVRWSGPRFFGANAQKQ